MSAADLSLSTQTPPPGSPPPQAPAAKAAGSATWLRVVLACGILLGSAGVRSLQGRRIEGELRKNRDRPRIDLDRLPMKYGAWQGVPTEIDPIIARGTGADQITTRRFVNQETGATVEAIVLFGPAVQMYVHSPEICYPAAGFAVVSGPESREISIETPGAPPKAPTKAPFRAVVYGKGEGVQTDLQEVYFSWRYNNRWSPDIGKQKQFERIPSMYKVHLARRVTGREKRDVGNPCESFLKVFLPEMERRVAAASQSPSS